LVENRTATPRRSRRPFPRGDCHRDRVIGRPGRFLVPQPPPQDAPPPPLTGPAKAYVKYLKFVAEDGVTPESPKMVAHESYLKLSVVEITGHIKNTGDRVLNAIEIHWGVQGPAHLPAGREHPRGDHPAGAGADCHQEDGGLAPGETKAFRVAFDNVPDDWNQALPTMVIAAIDFFVGGQDALLIPGCITEPGHLWRTHSCVPRRTLMSTPAPCAEPQRADGLCSVRDHS